MINRLQTYQLPPKDTPVSTKDVTKRRTPREIFASLRKAMEAKNNGQSCLDSEMKWELFETEEKRVADSDIVRRYKLPTEIDIYIKMRGTCVKSEDFRQAGKYGIDNTGLSKLWPSEACLALHCISDLGAHVFTGKLVLELGSGQSGLCGLAIASQFQAKGVVLSDGNLTCVKYLKDNIIINQRVLQCP